MIMGKASSLSCWLLAISLILLCLGLKYTLCTFISAFLALIVAFVEKNKSNKLEKKLKTYDDAFQTQYDKHDNITDMTIDNGTY